MSDFDYNSIIEFKKDIKKLKIPSLINDLKTFEKAFDIEKTDLTGLNHIPNLEKKGIKIPIYKAKKFRCKFLQKGSKSGIILIFAYDKSLDKVIFIEIYKKKDNSTNHNENRIIKHFKIN